MSRQKPIPFIIIHHNGVNKLDGAARRHSLPPRPAPPAPALPCLASLAAVPDQILCNSFNLTDERSPGLNSSILVISEYSWARQSALIPRHAACLGRGAESTPNPRIVPPARGELHSHCIRTFFHLDPRSSRVSKHSLRLCVFNFISFNVLGVSHCHCEGKESCKRTQWQWRRSGMAFCSQLGR